MTFLPIVTQLFLLKFCPESSYFSLLFDDEATLIVLRRRPEVQVDVIAIRDETSNTKDQPRPTLGAVFSTSLRWATTLSVLVMLMRQLSGMDVALQSILDVMITVGFTTLDGRWAMCGLMVDSSCFDRRPLRLIGIFGMFLSSVAVILALILIESRISTDQCSLSGIFLATIYMMSYVLGPGFIPWFYVNEHYKTSVRASGMSFACTISWILDFVVTFLFPLAKERFSSHSFLVFVVPLFASGIIALIHVTETKGKSISNIQTDLDESRPSCL